jgi:hypothetical protein
MPTSDGSKPATVQGYTVLITSDPSGTDLVEVARMVVLGGAATPAHEFSLLETKRVAEVCGLAQLMGTDDFSIGTSISDWGDGRTRVGVSARAVES